MKTYRNVPRIGIAIVAVLLVSHPLLTLAYLAAPVANTKNPTYITEKSAMMNGAINPNEVPDTYAWFEWGISGRTTVYETAHRQVGSGSTLTDFSENVYGLAPNVQYFYRQIAESSRGRDTGITTYFTTKTITEAIDPIVIIETRTPTLVLEKTATLRGYIAPHQGQGVKWWFEYGTTNKLENATQVNGWGTDSGVAQLAVSNLTPGTSYMYRIVAENTQGIVYGAVRSFNTAGIAPLPSETAHAQNIASPQAGDGVTRSGGSTQAGGGGVAAGYGAAQASGTYIPGAAYYPPAALNFPSFSFSSLFGNKSAANNTANVASANTNTAPAGTAASGSNVNTANSKTPAATAATPLGSFWNTLTGKKIAEVTVEKIGPSKAPAHTAVEYRVTYAYRRTTAATNAKLKIILPGSVVYIGDNTTNELLLEEGSGPERTYVLPVGRLESGSTRTISILGMTTSDAGGVFPDARARLEYSPSTGGVEVVSAEGTAAAAAATSKSSSSSSSSFSIFPSTILGWILYIALITLIIFGVRKARAFYVARKEEIALAEETQRREREGRQIGNGAIPA